MAQLITLDYALAQIPGVPSCDNNYVKNLITVASNVIETKTNRKFAFGTYDELHGPIGPTCSLWVNNPPITDVVWVRNSLMPAIYVQNNDPTSQCQFATIDVTTTAVVARKMFNNVLVTDETMTFVDYPTFAVLAAKINTLGNGWLATQPNQYALWQTSDLTTNTSGLNARNVSLPLCVYWYYLSQTKTNKDLGEIWVSGGPIPGHQNYRVKYTGGFAVVPAEIQQACAELVQLMYDARELDFNMLSETQDKYTYTRMVPNLWDMLSLGSKLAVQQYVIYRFTTSGVPAQE